MRSWALVKLAVVVLAAVGTAGGLSALRLEPQGQTPATGGAEKTVPKIWSRHTVGSLTAVNHAPWTDFLQGATLEERGVTRVAYSALSGEPRVFLDAYIEWLTTLTPSEWDRNEQLAYWLNLHNALTVRVIADAGGRGTVDRVRQFPVATTGPFAERTVMVEGHALSIDAIVHEVLRPHFNDTPFHYGLFTGAKGSPKLRRTAYDGPTVGASLDEQGRAFVNTHGVRVSRREIQLSSLYDWYAGDFGGADDAILRHVSAYSDDGLRAELQGRMTINRYRYDLAVASVIPRRYEPPTGTSFGSSNGLYGNQQPSFGGGS